jgi:hypothetical protein
MKSNKLKAGEHQRLSSILSPVDGLDYVSVVIPLSIDSRSSKGGAKYYSILKEK